MKIKLFSFAFGIALSATTINAGAQKTYTEGVITYITNMRGQDIEVKEFFTRDSVATVFTAGPATIRMLTDADHKSFETLIDVPAFSVKKAAIYTPDEVTQAMSGLPTFTFAPGTETKQISGFNCKKVTITNTKDNSIYDVWITNDISVPPAAVPVYYQGIGGFPVQYAAFNQGQVSVITVSGVSEDAAPAGIFSIPPDFDKISKADLEAMSGGG
jgi:GLPGLI family protein